MIAVRDSLGGCSLTFAGSHHNAYVPESHDVNCLDVPKTTADYYYLIDALGEFFEVWVFDRSFVVAGVLSDLHWETRENILEAQGKGHDEPISWEAFYEKVRTRRMNDGDDDRVVGEIPNWRELTRHCTLCCVLCISMEI